VYLTSDPQSGVTDQQVLFYSHLMQIKCKHINKTEIFIVFFLFRYEEHLIALVI